MLKILIVSLFMLSLPLCSLQAGYEKVVSPKIEPSISQTQVEQNNNRIISQYKNLKDLKQAYLKSFKEHGLNEQYMMLEKNDIIDKRMYPTPDPKTWKTEDRVFTKGKK